MAAKSRIKTKPNPPGAKDDKGIIIEKPSGQNPERLASLDALRGFVMFWIIGGDDILNNIALIIHNRVFSNITVYFTQHVKWEGFHFYDLIFPLFLFLSGVSIAFSIKNRLDKGMEKKILLLKIIKRTLILFALGLIFYGALQFKGFEHVRIFGVLQRIALGYCFAALIVLYTNMRVQITVSVIILLIYWALLKLIPVPGFPPGTLTINGNLVGYIDRSLFLPGQLLWRTFDPEGLLSTLPAISTALLGVFTGYWLKSGQKEIIKTAGLFGSGAVLLITGSIWGIFFPVVKNLWTSSFVLVAGGWSLLYLGLFYLLIDVLKLKKWAFIFIIIGVNSITIYVGQEIISFYGITGYFVNGILKWIPFQRGLILACCILTVKLLFLAFLKRHKIYLRV